jgi:hypothetical protein
LSAFVRLTSRKALEGVQVAVSLRGIPLTLRARLAHAEARLAILRPGLRVISIRGGLEDGVADCATIDGRPFKCWEASRAMRFVSERRPTRLTPGRGSSCREGCLR